MLLFIVIEEVLWKGLRHVMHLMAQKMQLLIARCCEENSIILKMEKVCQTLLAIGRMFVTHSVLSEKQSKIP